MARYDREFLVPYLEDICSLQYAKLKLTKLIEDCDNKVDKIVENARNSVPAPGYEREDGKAPVLKIGCSAVLVLIGLVSLPIGLLDWMTYNELLTIWLGFGFLGAGIFVCVNALVKHKSQKGQTQKRNQSMYQQYLEDVENAVKAAEPEKAKVFARKDFYASQRDAVDDILEETYGVNVIPRWYRDVYAAVYLYDWFSNSRADDLDMALNTFVLEQIKDKLDVIIQNQSEALLNQRIMIANQEKAMEQAERHHAALMSKLDEMQALDEERNTYLSMINANASTSAFFATATYLRY